MRSLNLDQLRALLLVIEHGSFSAAARHLNLTQPAISLQIRGLEERFNIRLVERIGKRAFATPPGQHLADYARKILEECEHADASMRRFGHDWIGRVHIGTTLTALTYQLPPILKRLRAEHADLDLQVTNMPTRDSVEHILQNKLDFALVTLPVKDAQLIVTRLSSEQLVAILPPDTGDVPDVVSPAYASRQQLVLEHKRGAVHGLVEEWIASALPLALTPMHIGTVEAMKTAVAAGLGVAFVPDIAVRSCGSDLLVRPIQPSADCNLGLIEHRLKRPDPARDIVREALLTIRTQPPAVQAPLRG